MLRASPCPDRMVNTVLTTSRLSLQNNGLDVADLHLEDILFVQ